MKNPLKSVSLINYFIKAPIELGGPYTATVFIPTYCLALPSPPTWSTCSKLARQDWSIRSSENS
eukprot:4679776-Amphidinium_carterae.1